MTRAMNRKERAKVADRGPMVGKSKDRESRKSGTNMSTRNCSNQAREVGAVWLYMSRPDLRHSLCFRRFMPVTEYGSIQHIQASMAGEKRVNASNLGRLSDSDLEELKKEEPRPRP